MAEYLHFSRDSRLYMAKDGYLWSIPVLDGFSFSQATNATEITLNEMEDSSGRSRRGRKPRHSCRKGARVVHARRAGDCSWYGSGRGRSTAGLRARMLSSCTCE